MARHDLSFSPLRTGKNTSLSEWYLSKLHETKSGFEGTHHLMWSGPTNTWGFPAHKVFEKIFPLSGFLLYKNDFFRLAPDEVVKTFCGIGNCCQTAHMCILPKSLAGHKYANTKAILDKLRAGHGK